MEALPSPTTAFRPLANGRFTAAFSAPLMPGFGRLLPNSHLQSCHSARPSRDCRRRTAVYFQMALFRVSEIQILGKLYLAVSGRLVEEPIG